MVCVRQASLISTTRISATMASSIWRIASAWRPACFRRGGIVLAAQLLNLAHPRAAQHQPGHHRVERLAEPGFAVGAQRSGAANSSAAITASASRLRSATMAAAATGVAEHVFAGMRQTVALIERTCGVEAFSSMANSASGVLWGQAGQPELGSAASARESASGRVTATMIHQRDRGTGIKGDALDKARGPASSAATPQQPARGVNFSIIFARTRQMDGLHCACIGKNECMGMSSCMWCGRECWPWAQWWDFVVVCWASAADFGDSGAGAAVWHGSIRGAGHGTGDDCAQCGDGVCSGATPAPPGLR